MSEKRRQSERTDAEETEPNASTRMPFDTSDLNRIPTATEEDPPYRNWWVGDEALKARRNRNLTPDLMGHGFQVPRRTVMARTTRLSHSHDLIGRLSDTIANHLALERGSGFSDGCLAGAGHEQHRCPERPEKTAAAAPGAIASHIPTFGWFEDKPARKASRRRRAPATASQPTARKTRAASGRKTAKRSRAA